MSDWQKWAKWPPRACLEPGPENGKPAFCVAYAQQGRQDSNLQPPVLETGALPIELRPWASCDCRRALSGITGA